MELDIPLIWNTYSFLKTKKIHNIVMKLAKIDLHILKPEETNSCICFNIQSLIWLVEIKLFSKLISNSFHVYVLNNNMNVVFHYFCKWFSVVSLSNDMSNYGNLYSFFSYHYHCIC